MIPPYVPAHRARFAANPGSAWRTLCVCAALVAVLAVASCDKAALTAPTGATITLFSNTTIVPLGGTAEITAQVFASGNVPVHNGTVVDFTTTIGTIDPAEVRTHDGKATARLYPGTTSGKATVRAFSGGINSGDLALTIGAAAVSKITLGASASSVPSNGGTVTLFAVVVDADGNPVPNVPVVFTTTAGSLGVGTVTTDATGRATTTLTTSSTAQVTATAGTVASTALTITAAAKPSVTLSASTTTPSVGQPVSFTVGVTPSSGATTAAIRSVSISFGDGKSQSLGTGASSTASNTYSSAGTYTVTATATDANGESGSATVIILVTPVTLGLTPSPSSGAPPLTVAFTLTITPSTAAVSSVDWDFGDGESAPNTPQLTISHVYTRSSTWTATATVHFVGGGTPRTAQTQVRVAQ
jgi:PKD repeat protein